MMVATVIFSSVPVQRLEAFVCNCPFLYSSSRASRESCLCRSEINPRAEEDNTPIPGIDVRGELNNWLNSNLLASESSKSSDCSGEESNQVHLAFRTVESLLLCQSQPINVWLRSQLCWPIISTFI